MTTLSGFKTTIRLSAKNKERTDMHAKENGSTLNNLVNIALDKLFENIDKDNRQEKRAV